MHLFNLMLLLRQRYDLAAVEADLVAAIEAAFFNCVSFAVSLEYTKPGPLDFPRAAAVGRRVVEQILSRRPAPGTLFNINIPDLERGPVRGVRVVPQNVVPYRETLDRRVDPRGRVYFWCNGDLTCPDPHPDSDVSAMAEGYVTVTPLQFNLTHAGLLERMGEWGLSL